ncbi:MAG: hypothetical protein K0S41_4045 [Anaerocolumna sp.]|jgi:hypothetical protein|nr:hypothetical protein [Anaerocolumna sp.]
MTNPWEKISLSDYEEHMKLQDIMQLQTLNKIMQNQINQYPVKTITILGIAGGNGLEYINPEKHDKVYGIDINKAYLEICKNRFPILASCLELKAIDLMDINTKLPKSELIIANLLIEYIGVETLIKHMKQTLPKVISCVIQKNIDQEFVSSSPYQQAFQDLSSIHTDVHEELLVECLKTINYKVIVRKEYLLPNKKMFIRIDFKMMR